MSAMLISSSLADRVGAVFSSREVARSSGRFTAFPLLGCPDCWCRSRGGMRPGSSLRPGGDRPGWLSGWASVRLFGAPDRLHEGQGLLGADVTAAISQDVQDRLDHDP